MGEVNRRRDRRTAEQTAAWNLGHGADAVIAAEDVYDDALEAYRADPSDANKAVYRAAAKKLDHTREKWRRREAGAGHRAQGIGAP